MKQVILKSFIVFLGIVCSCSDDFFENLPPGAANAQQFHNEKGIDLLLVGAYSLLDGMGATTDGSSRQGDGEFYIGSAGSNWLFGDVRGGDAAKGSHDYDQASAGLIERHEIGTSSGLVAAKWITCFDGISRCNDVLKAIKNTTSASQEFLAQRSAEARFLRGHYYFELKKIFGGVPWVDENTTDYKQPNQADIWSKIEDDFQYALEILSSTQSEVGRATTGASKAYLAKAYLFQKKFNEAKILLDDIVASGRYGLLDCFRYASDMEHKNQKESIFAAQTIVNDGSSGINGNWGDILNHPNASIEGTCCGFFQPSYDLVNAFKTDLHGLPLLETYQDSEVINDFYPTPISPDAPYAPHAGALDPRVDWTAGRRGIPYLDWGVHPGSPWIRNSGFGGPYLPVKRNFTKAQKSIGTDNQSWAGGSAAINIEFIRYADVLLWSAEVEVEIGDLEIARARVNEVRRRAAKSDCFVKALDADGKPTSTPAANYVIEQYTVPWTDKTYALNAVKFERRLELAMEGHRFFDLVRWGEADVVLNRYLNVESPKRQQALKDATFIKGKHEYLPIPESEIINSSKGGIATLIQNPGY
jgi:starch-binding outer membrane protein, SusD/RagB family